jgi:SAM-dependent methyltransferase
VESGETDFVRRSQSFGAVAEVYDRARPGYPDGLFAHIAAQLPGPRVLEVGAGTGIATQGLTARGLDVTCIEPDVRMAAVLRQRTAARPPSRIEIATFESAALDGLYDGLVSALAWHWTDPENRMDRVASLLRPGGFVGLVWNGGVVRQPEIFEAVGAIYDDFALLGSQRPGEPMGSADELSKMQDPQTWPGDELGAHPQFDYCGTTLFQWRLNWTATQFAAFLESTSFFRVLKPEVGRGVLDAIVNVIRDRFGDLVTIDWSTQCYNARRISAQSPGVTTDA